MISKYPLSNTMGVWDVLIRTEQPDDVADVLILTEFVATIVAKSVLEAVILDELPIQYSADDSLKSVVGSSRELLTQAKKAA